MCGILGGNNSKWNYAKGIESMQHRGPDGIKISTMEEFTFAFARLAIIDLSDRGMQPMFSQNQKVGIVFNGEIYGFQKLRNELIKKGYNFISTGDTEVILNAYLEWGDAFIDKIDGMFGLAIYDLKEKKVKLFRDRVGIKPLYYYYDGKNFGFSSELKGITNMCNDVSFRIDETAIYDYLNYLYIPEPKTYYHNVYKLQPGHWLEFDIKTNKINKIESYWKLRVNTTQGKTRKEQDLQEELKCLIEESVKEQLIADVSVATFLSGGVDSSIVTFEGSKLKSELEAFTIGFTESKYNEIKYAREVAKKINIKLNEKIFNRKVFGDSYLMLKKWYDEPFADTSAFPTYIVSKFAREKVKVVLTGDGGDEIFGGYYRQSQMLRKEEERGYDNLLISKIYSRLKLPPDKDYFWLDDLSYLLKSNIFPLRKSDRELRKELHISKDYDKYWFYRKYYNKELPPITRIQYLDLKTYLPGDILTKVDRASMAVSLETRVPLLSKRIIEFAFSISQQDRCPEGEAKGLLKRAYVNDIGRQNFYRRKMGFSMPTDYFGNNQSPQENLLYEIWK